MVQVAFNTCILTLFMVERVSCGCVWILLHYMQYQKFEYSLWYWSPTLPLSGCAVRHRRLESGLWTPRLMLYWPKFVVRGSLEASTFSFSLHNYSLNHNLIYLQQIDFIDKSTYEMKDLAFYHWLTKRQEAPPTKEELD